MSESTPQVNKKIIRENITPQEQIAFFDFFTKLEDQEEYQNWTLTRVQQVIEQFKNMQKQSHKKRQTEGKAKQQKINTPEKSNNAKRSSQQILLPPKLSLDQTNRNSHQKMYSSLNLLNEIQFQKAIKTPNKVESKTSEGWNVKSQEWLTMTKVLGPKKIQQCTQNQDIFKNFDLFINQSNSPLKKQKEPSKIIKQNSFSSSKSQKIISISTDQKPQTAVNRSSLSERQKDKIFKWKLFGKTNCTKLQHKMNVQSVLIANHQMVHRIFLPDYAIYHLKVVPIGTICKRTYDDFVKLRDNLQKTFPGIKIPYLESGSWLAESDILLINKNKSHLERFIKGLLQHPTLSISANLRDFLTIQDHKAMKKINQNYQKCSIITSLSGLASSEGLIHYQLSQEQNKLIDKLPKWQNFIDCYFEKYSDLISTLTTQYQAMIQTYQQIYNLVTDTKTKLSQFYDKNSLIQSQQFQTFFKSQQTHYKYRKQSLEKEVTSIKQIFLPFIQYQKINNNLFTPLINQVKNMTEKYLKRLQNEPESPSSTTEQNNNEQVICFKEGINQESQDLLSFKYQVGYFNKQLLQQYRLFNHRFIKNLSSSWNQLIKVAQNGQSLHAASKYLY